MTARNWGRSWMGSASRARVDGDDRARGADRVIADKGYSYARCRQLLRQRGRSRTPSQSAATSEHDERPNLVAR